MSKANKGKSAAVIEAEKPAFLGDLDGITAVEVDGGGYAIAFAYDRQLGSMMRGVPGAEYIKGDDLYLIPATSTETLGKVVDAMRAEFKAIKSDSMSINELAAASARQAQRDHGTDSAVSPQIGDFHEVGKFYGGEIVNANTRFIAQFSGFGKKDGAAFITIHRLADLDRSKIMKGDNVGIQYDEKFRGAVIDRSQSKSDAELEVEYENNLGKAVDGVTLSDRGSKIGVAFDVNPALLSRIRRVDGAAFDFADKVWEVPTENKVFALRAAHDMRREFAMDKIEVALMQGIAEGKIDGAKVGKAFTKDGHEHFGKILAVGDRYALQKTGQDKFSLHHLASLNQKPVVDQNLAIKYNRGTGTVVDQDQKRAIDKALGVGR